MGSCAAKLIPEKETRVGCLTGDLYCLLNVWPVSRKLSFLRLQGIVC